MHVSVFPSRTVRASLVAGIVAGSIDILAACLINHRDPGYVLQSIAGGLLAERSFAGGVGTVLLGLLLQEVIGVVIAAVYLLTAERWDVLAREWISCGLVYGAVIFIVMNYVVMPLSAWRAVPGFTVRSFLENLVAMFLFGLIVSFGAHRARQYPSEQELSR